MIIKAAVRNLRRSDAPEVVTAAASIEEEVARLNGVVSDVLDFARPIKCVWAPADLVETARAAADAVRTVADDIPIAVETASATAALITDRERLRSVLINLLSNAQQAVRARYSAGTAPAPGAHPIRVTIRPLAGDHWEVAVIDTGVGIPADALPHVFEPFFTTHRTGSGLGLAISRNIVESLGGTIAIDSRAGSGTTVRIDLRSRACEPAT
jgi:signal transduction histidine kinase